MSIQAQNEYCTLLDSAASTLKEKPGTTCAWLATFITRVRRSLARPARILLLGEANAGKSSLANLLIGEAVVPTSVVENSRFPVQFHYAPRPSLEALLSDGRRITFAWSQVDEAAQYAIEAVRVGLPVERLKLFEVVDTPGGSTPSATAARLSAHAQLACLPIWCTVAARAWKESERAAWINFPASLRGRAILAITQTDLLPHAGDLSRVIDRLNLETGDLFGTRIPLAIPDAVRSSVVGKDESQGLWTASGGETLESVLTAALDDIAVERVAAARRILTSVLAREQQRNRLSGRPRTQLAAKDFEKALALRPSGETPDNVIEIPDAGKEPGVASKALPLVLQQRDAGNAAAPQIGMETAGAS